MDGTRIHRVLGVLLVVCIASCGPDRLRVEDNEVRGRGFRMPLPTGFQRKDAGSSTSYRVVLLEGPSGQLEAPTIRHSETGPTHSLNGSECKHAAKDYQRMLATGATVGGRPGTVASASLTDHPVLGPVCAFLAQNSARASAIRQFNVREQGSRVTCEANDAEQAQALCDAYLASATK